MPELTAPGPAPDPTPSDVTYDDMTRAWRNGDYPLAWHLADVLLQYLANDGQPLTGPDRKRAYVHAIHNRYAPPWPRDPVRERMAEEARRAGYASLAEAEDAGDLTALADRLGISLSELDD